MSRILLKIIIGVLSGYLFTMWLPIKSPFDIGVFFISFVVYPIKFFAASIAFTVAVLVNGSLMKECITNTIREVKKGNFLQKDTIVCYAVIFNFIFLFHIGWIQSFVFLCFTLLYVMISLYF